MVPFVLLYPSKDTVYVFLQRGTDQEFFFESVGAGCAEGGNSLST